MSRYGGGGYEPDDNDYDEYGDKNTDSFSDLNDDDSTPSGEVYGWED